MLRPIDVTILFFRKSWLHVVITGGAYEIRVEPADNGLTDLKRGTERSLRESHKTSINQEGITTLMRARKNDKIA